MTQLHRTTTGLGSAHAKVILIGEHAVVHGLPAIALPVPDLTVTARASITDGESWLQTSTYSGPVATAPDHVASLVTAILVTAEIIGVDAGSLRVEVDSTFPIGSGLGSSAAAANAIIDAVSDLHAVRLSPVQRFDLAQAAERVAHGTPSGLDAHATRADHPVRFRSGVAEPLEVAFGTAFVIADTGVPGSTKTAVADVRTFLADHPDRGQALLNRLAILTEDAAVDLAHDRRSALGGRMTEAQAILDELGVGHPAITACVDAAIAAGALGAKLTGGGRGGCVLALAAEPSDTDDIARAMRDAGAVDTWVVQMGETNVRL